MASLPPVSFPLFAPALFIYLFIITLHMGGKIGDDWLKHSKLYIAIQRACTGICVCVCLLIISGCPLPSEEGASQTEAEGESIGGIGGCT